MDDQFTTRADVRDEVISILSDLRVEQGLDVVHMDDDSPIFGPGLERGETQSANIVLELESEFGINITDNPSIIAALGTIGRLTDYIMQRLGERGAAG